MNPTNAIVFWLAIFVCSAVIIFLMYYNFRKTDKKYVSVKTDGGDSTIIDLQGLLNDIQRDLAIRFIYLPDEIIEQMLLNLIKQHNRDIKKEISRQSRITVDKAIMRANH